MISFRDIPFCAVEGHLPVPPYVLLKTGRMTPWDRWSILGWDPWLRWTPSGHGNPFEELGALYDALQQTTYAPMHVRTDAPPLPLLMGAIAYDAGRAIETIPATARREFDLPDMVFYGFRRYLVMDEREKQGYRVCVASAEMRDEGRGTSARPYVAAGLDEGRKSKEVASLVPANGVSGRPSSLDFFSNFTRTSYMAAVEAIRVMIAAGDCYQVNLSQQLRARASRPAAALFREALAANPAPMMALVDAGDFQLISTSPERLIQRRGDRLISRPIKGTRPRGTVPARDTALREELLHDPKENAELAMIVDLVRNDLGRVARPGTVTVDEPRAIESYANVHHLLATISACAAPNMSWPDIFRALFPGGSVTGCPKVQAMRVIEAMEGVRRGFYCGSIGYLTADGDGDWNIAIRTITKVGEAVTFNLGGAITYDSDPAAEYEETLQKGRTLKQILVGS